MSAHLILGVAGPKGYGCSPFKEVRELGLKRRETVWSPFAVGAGNLKGLLLVQRTEVDEPLVYRL